MAYVTEKGLKQKVASLLAQDPAALASRWDEIIPDAREAAVNTVRDALRNRDYTTAQIEAWDRLEEFSTDIGLWFALIKGAALHGFDDRYVKLLDRRLELATVILLEVEDPSGAGVAHGRLDTSGDRFVLPTSSRQDPRIGRITRF